MIIEKISAYVVWNLVDRDENKLKITERGRRLAQAATQEERNKIYIEIIRSNEAYYGVMEWAYNNAFDCLTNISVATYWMIILNMVWKMMRILL